MSAKPLFIAVALFALAVLAAGYGSFQGPFVYDDIGNVVENSSIRHLTAVCEVLSPPVNSGLGGRPLLNLSFAISYALSGLDVRGYHAMNLAIHLLAGLTLAGLVRQTLASSRFGNRFATVALPLAFVAALVWTLHPAQTASVTYLSQRAESLMGLFYFLTLYCFARATLAVPSKYDHPNRALTTSRPWLVAAVAACFAGMATKEVMMSAPLMVLLYDRTFVAGNFRAALRSQPRFYFGLASSWLLLAFLLADVSARGVGDAHGVSWQTYALTECRAVINYLRLGLWPQPLVFDYGANFITTFGDAAPYALLLVPLLVLTVIALVRRPVLGFLGAWFFVILAPTSSFIPVAFMPFAENRLYLPLAALVVSVTLGLYSFAGRLGLAFAVMLAGGCGWLTARRNEDYRSDVTLWRDTVNKRPDNAYARYNLGVLYARDGNQADAIVQWQATLRDLPDYTPAHNNLANAFASMGRLAEAIPHYQAALRSQPFFPVAHANYGLILLQAGRPQEAETQLRLSLKQDPANPAAYNNLGLVLAQLGRIAEAVGCFEKAVQLQPAFGAAQSNLDRSRAALSR